MKRKLEGIRQLPSGKYQANYYGWTIEDGKVKRIRPRESFDTIKEAKEWREDGLRREGQKPDPRAARMKREARTRTIADMVAHYKSLERYRSIRPSTKKAYDTSIRHFHEFCESHGITFLYQFMEEPENGELTWAQKYYDHVLARGHKFSGVTNKMRVANMLFVVELRRRPVQIDHNPFSDIDYERKPNMIRSKAYLSEEGLMALLREMTPNVRMRYLLLFGSSMRSGELRHMLTSMRIAPDVVDLSQHPDWQAKTDGPELRMLSPEAMIAWDYFVDLNRNRVTGQPAKYLLRGQWPAGTNFFDRHLDKAKEAATKKTGIDFTYITPHKFRKSFLSRLAQSGADMAAIRDLAGHKSIKTTERVYAFLRPHDLRRNMALVPPLKMEEILDTIDTSRGQSPVNNTE